MSEIWTLISTAELSTLRDDMTGSQLHKLGHFIDKNICSIFFLTTKLSHCICPYEHKLFYLISFLGVEISLLSKLKLSLKLSSRLVFLNRRDASQYRDLETYLPGLLKPQNLEILPLSSLVRWVEKHILLGQSINNF